jgi:catechol 2,3-dioxygenase-like lactoylglutathione lyase family enzyme
MAAVAVRGFNHTAFTVDDLDRTVRFFTEALGFELRSLAPRNPDNVGRITGLGRAEVRIAYVDGYGHTLELIEFQQAEHRTRAEFRATDIGAAHIALDVEHLAAAVETATQWGWARLGEIIEVDAGPNAGRQIVYLRHEDGIILEFIQDPT